MIEALNFDKNNFAKTGQTPAKSSSIQRDPIEEEMNSYLESFFTLLNVSEKVVSRLENKDEVKKCQKLEKQFIEAKMDIEMIKQREKILNDEIQNKTKSIDILNIEIEKIEFNLNIMNKSLNQQ